MPTVTGYSKSSRPAQLVHPVIKRARVGAIPDDQQEDLRPTPYHVCDSVHEELEPMPGAQNAGEADNEIILANAELLEQGHVSQPRRKSIGIYPVGHYDAFSLRHPDRFQILLERS